MSPPHTQNYGLRCKHVRNALYYGWMGQQQLNCHSYYNCTTSFVVGILENARIENEVFLFNKYEYLLVRSIHTYTHIHSTCCIIKTTIKSKIINRKSVGKQLQAIVLYFRWQLKKVKQFSKNNNKKKTIFCLFTYLRELCYIIRILRNCVKLTRLQQ